MSDAIVWIGEHEPAETSVVGGKGRGLDQLTRAGLRVPQAFVVGTGVFRDAISGSLREEVGRRIAALAGETDIAALEAATAGIRELIVAGTEGHRLDGAIRAAFARLQDLCADDQLAVAVRSSSAAEDSADRSFAGEHDSYLWVLGADEVSAQVRNCWASLFTTRAVAYRASSQAGEGDDDAMAVVVQRMVDARAAGVMMTLNPANGDRSKVVIEALWGLGEPLVSGTATPDRFIIDKVTREIVARDLTDKPTRLVRDRSTGRGTVEEPVEADRCGAAALTDEQILALVEMGRSIEKHAGRPQDAEFAVAHGAGRPEDVFLLQARPETVWSNRGKQRISSVTSGSALSRVVETLTIPPSRRE